MLGLIARVFVVVYRFCMIRQSLLVIGFMLWRATIALAGWPGELEVDAARLADRFGLPEFQVVEADIPVHDGKPDVSADSFGGAIRIPDHPSGKAIVVVAGKYTSNPSADNLVLLLAKRDDGYVLIDKREYSGGRIFYVSYSADRQMIWAVFAPSSCNCVVWRWKGASFSYSSCDPEDDSSIEIALPE